MIIKLQLVTAVFGLRFFNKATPLFLSPGVPGSSLISLKNFFLRTYHLTVSVRFPKWSISYPRRSIGYGDDQRRNKMATHLNKI